jgi:dolichyl-diphosphooligosaccharide--protein glycosyltransferase
LVFLKTWLTKITRPKIKRRSLLIGLVLIIAFSTALLIRSYPVKYGFYLNEFDPFYDYRATQFIVDSVDKNGISGLFDYFSWRDYQAWFPEGRDVPATSQNGLQFVGATLYLLGTNLFGLSITLYDFLVLLPVFFGSLTVIVVFFITKKIASVGAGIVASMIVAFSPSLVIRGNLGWFKSEPLALFLAILAFYFFLEASQSSYSGKKLLMLSLLGGFLLGLANASWGGVQYFNGVVGLLLLISPFLKIDLKRLVYTDTIFVASNLFVSSAFPRPGPTLISGPSGLILFAGLAFVYLAYFLKNRIEPKNYLKGISSGLIVLILVGLSIVGFGFITLPFQRYLTVLNPFMGSTNALIESVGEHQTPTGANFFISFSVLIILGAFGSLILFRRRDLTSAFALILGLTSVYFASSFSRLMVFASISLAILAGLGLIELTRIIFRHTLIHAGKKKTRLSGIRPELKLTYVIVMIIALGFPASTYWIPFYDTPTSMATSALPANPGHTVPDWLEALTWMNENTPQNSVIVSWWDYGYWITVVGNRTSVADNATINSTRIAQIGTAFMSNEEEGMKIIKDLKGDYVAVFVGARQIDPETNAYILGTGGDEGKVSWFVGIPGLNGSLYFENYVSILNHGGFTDYFWSDTLLGKMFPLELIGYFAFDNFGRLVDQSDSPKQGYVPLYTYKIKYPQDGDGPLTLAYASSFKTNDAQVLIYKVE